MSLTSDWWLLRSADMIYTGVLGLGARRLSSSQSAAIEILFVCVKSATTVALSLCRSDTNGKFAQK